MRSLLVFVLLGAVLSAYARILPTRVQKTVHDRSVKVVRETNEEGTTHHGGVGDKVESTLEEHGKEDADHIKADVKDVKEKMKITIENAEKYGKEVADRIKEFFKNLHISKDKLKGTFESAKAYGKVVADQIKEELKDVKGKIESRIENAKQYGKEVADHIKEGTAGASEKPNPEDQIKYN